MNFSDIVYISWKCLLDPEAELPIITIISAILHLLYTLSTSKKLHTRSYVFPRHPYFQLNNSMIVDQNTFIFRNLLHFFIYHIALTRTCQEINFRIYLTKSNTVLSFFLFCFFSYQIIRHSFHLLFFLCILKNKKSNPRCYICLVSC